MASSNKVQLGVLALIGTLVFATLIIGIVTLVKVNEKKDNTETTTVDPTAPTQKPGPGPNDDLNIPGRKPIDPKDNAERFDAFSSYVSTLHKSLNTSANPCDNFWEYTCGKYDDVGDFSALQWGNVLNLLNALKKPNDQPYAQKTRAYFDHCVKARREPEHVHQDGDAVRQIIGYLRNFDLPAFPALGGGVVKPGAKKLGNILGTMSSKLGIHTFVTPIVNTDWAKPANGHGEHHHTYRIYLDQPTLTYPMSYYKKIFDKIEGNFKEAVQSYIRQFAAIVNGTVDEAMIESDVNDFVALEKRIAEEFNVDGPLRRNYDRQYNKYTYKQGQFLVDPEAFLSSYAVGSPDVADLVQQKDFEFIVNEPATFAKLEKALNHDSEARLVANYVNIRLLLGIADFFPPPRPYSMADDLLREARGVQLGRSLRPSPLPLPQMPDVLAEGVDRDELLCAYQTARTLSASTSRLYVDEVLPSAEKRTKSKEQVTLLVNNVVAGFQAQLDRLSWMSKETKEQANDKVKYLVKNVAFPDWVEDDDKLNDYYSELALPANITYVDFVSQVNAFNQKKDLAPLLSTQSVARDDFLMSMAIVNAWYQPEVNSITFPYGILQRPFYDPNYPAAVNYGAIGVVAGHELTHGFDDEGVQYDGIGFLRTWMDDTSKAGFHDMAQCVVDEYDSFEPFPGLHLDGSNTQGENIADNGGIHAAYNAFQAHQAFYGPDPLLPDAHLSGFSPEQLFFLAFARVWCRPAQSRDQAQRQILLDPHAPAKYRVFGTVQNFPAFRSAFNCPAGAAYAPQQHCDVWSSDSTKTGGVPDTPQVAPDTKLRPNPESNSTAYGSVAARLGAQLNLQQQPCDDFQAYACFEQKPVDDSAAAEQLVEDAVVSLLHGELDKTEDRLLEGAHNLFKTCTALSNGSNVVQHIFDMLAEDLGPLQIANEDPTHPALTASAIGSLSHYFKAVFGIDLFYKLEIKPNPVKKPNTPAYVIHLDAPDLPLTTAAYTDYAQVNQFTAYITDLFRQHVGSLSPKQDQYLQTNVNAAMSLLEDLSTYESVSKPALLTMPEAMEKFAVFGLDAYLKKTVAMEGRYVQELADELNKRTAIVVLDSDRLMPIASFLQRALESDEQAGYYNMIYSRALFFLQHFMAAPVGVQLDPSKLNKPFLPAVVRTGAVTDEILHSCAKQVAEFMPQAYARSAFVALYLTDNVTTVADYKKQEKYVAEVVEHVIKAYEARFTELSWMPLETRKSFVAKLHGIARNIGVPARLTEPAFTRTEKEEAMVQAVQRDAHQFGDDQKLLTSWLNAQVLKRVYGWVNLFSAHVERSLYLTAAQLHSSDLASYDHGTNTLSLSLSALQQPFASADNPASWTFATLGRLVARLVADLFTEEGFQHDEVGQTRNWADEDTISSYNQMKRQVRLFARRHVMYLNDKDLVEQSVAVQIAYEAFVEWSVHHGLENELPDQLLEKFTPKQLFFLALGQQHCSEDVYVQKRLQLFLTLSTPFRNTFRCESGEQYNPAEMVEVGAECELELVQIWNTESEGFVGAPDTEEHAVDLQIPQRAQNLSDAYAECAEQFEASVDVGADPCNNFYQYACGRYAGTSPFEDADLQNQVRLLKAVMEVASPLEPQPIQLVKSFNEECRAGLERLPALNQDGAVVKEIIADLEQVLDQQFPLAHRVTAVKRLTPAQLGSALGRLSGRHGVGALLDNMVYTNARNPDKGYSVYVDCGYYALAPLLQDYARETVVQYATMQLARFLFVDDPKVEERLEEISAEVEKFVDLEVALAASHDPTPRDSRNASQTYPATTLADAIANFPRTLDLRNYMAGLASLAPQAHAKITADKSELVILDPKDLFSFLTALETLETDAKLTPVNLVNYLFYRALTVSNGAFVPPLPHRLRDAARGLPARLADPVRDLGWRRRVPEAPGAGVRAPERRTPLDAHPLVRRLGFSRVDVQCYQITTSLFQEAANALFVSATWPDEAARKSDRLAAAKFADSVMVGFRSMLDQLAWLRPASKAVAYTKIENLVKNVAYPNMSVDVDQLTDYYQDTDLDRDDNFAVLLRKMLVFNVRKQFEDLARPVYDRTNFGAAYVMNAWYQPAANSITLPAAILQQPFYDPEWPQSVNYGAIGAVAGHELVHGFDDGGVQWDAVGRLRTWVDEDSMASFRQMADCVVAEYANFTAPDGRHVNGRRTQGENIADNGGIQAAFRAYRAAAGVEGPDAQLPGPLLARFTHDQLFFLSFARVWCHAPYQPEDWDRVLADVHAPAPHRVLGTVQNFPAFRDAFHCPVGAAYAPPAHCKVWVTEVQPSLAVPTPLPPKPIEVPPYHPKQTFAKKNSKIVV